MQREEDATYSGSGHSGHYSGHHNGHSHGAPPPEEDEYDEDDEEDYDSQDEYDEEEDEMVIANVFNRSRVLLKLSRKPSQKTSVWKKAEGCSRSSLLVCLNRGC